jgi:putative ABC transport system permease protein
VFVRFTRALAADIDNAGSTLNCSGPPEQPGFAGLKASDCVWVAFMVELDDPAAAAGYRDYLDAYAREQQRIGRFSWPPNNRLRDLRSWLDFWRVAPADAGISLLVALSLLAVCLVNTVGLLLAKFLRRSGEIGVRRALGAPRRAIHAQFLTEAGVIGLAGGALGLLLTALGLTGAGIVLSADIAPLVRVDMPLIGLTVLVAAVSALAAGLYPTLRASRVQPALQLKSN